MSERKLALLMTPARDRYANLLNQLKEIIKSAPVDVVITTVDDWKSTHIENLTIEDLKQNHHVQELLEDLKFYANPDSWEVSAIDELCTVKTKLTKDKESFGECEQAGLASKLVIYGGKRARARLSEWGL